MCAQREEREPALSAYSLRDVRSQSELKTIFKGTIACMHAIQMSVIQIKSKKHYKKEIEKRKKRKDERKKYYLMKPC